MAKEQTKRPASPQAPAGRRAAVARSLRRRAPQLLLSLATALLALGAAEAGLRAWLPVQYRPPVVLLMDRALHHRFPSRATMYAGQVQGQHIRVDTNDDGLRSPYTRAAFTRHRVRVALLGDSFVFGPGVPYAQTVAPVLEAELNRRHPGLDVAVLNAGVISSSPLLQAVAYRRVIRHYRPTHTLMLLDLTDIGDDHHYRQEMRGALREGPTFQVTEDDGPYDWDERLLLAYLAAGHLRRAAAPLVASVQAWLGRKPTPEPKYDYGLIHLDLGGLKVHSRFFVLRLPLAKTRPVFDQTVANLADLNAQARDLGSTFSLMITPRFHHWSHRECPDNWERFEYKLDEPYAFEYFRYFAQRRAELPYPVVDLLPAFQATREFPLCFAEDPHWNRAGHRFVARLLARHLDGLLAAGAGAGAAARPEPGGTP